MKTLLKLLLLSLVLSSIAYAENPVVDQKGKTFIPHHLSVKVGDTITFKNSDDFAHNVYTDDEANEFDVGMQAAGTSSTVPVKAAGKFIVECAIHPNMLLEVTATEK
jgi:plastocyanin